VDCLLETNALTKSFSGIRVLNGVSFSARRGQIHALMGENGAGKSTFMKIVAGLEQPDSGHILWKGNEVRFRNPHAALCSGIAMIHQELMPFPDMTVAENVLMGVEPQGRFPGCVNRAALRSRTAEVLSSLGLHVSPSRRMRELAVAEQQVVEIAKALVHRAELLIMDEPTSALGVKEAESLFATVRSLRDQGVAVIYISHKLDEIYRLADQITVLRDGTLITTAATAQLPPERLISMMVGRDLAPAQPEPDSESGETLLAVRGLSKRGRFQDIGFEVRAGEILGLAGLMGAGRTDILNAIFGLAPASTGEVQVRGMPVSITQPKDAIRAGIGLVTEDRKTYGLVPDLGVPGNLTLASLSRWCRWGWILRSDETAAAAETVSRFRIACAGGNQAVERLSGGNQQKVVLGRTFLHRPEIVLLDEPTRGIDIGAKAEVHDFIRRLAREGKAIVLASSELPELLSLCHRLLVIRQGRIAGEMDPHSATQEAILKLALPA
jgi:ABC-type sugar transport system ATPase subunit